MSKKKQFYEKHTIRACAICDKFERSFIYRQQFLRIKNTDILEGYDLVTCENCGFTFADRLPTQRVFDKYYNELSKYESNDLKGGESIYDTNRFISIVDLIIPYLGKNSKILDIGCATGKLLSIFKEKGYQNLLGIDPSKKCSIFAKNEYGIDILVGALLKISYTKQKFDCIILAGVLEHVKDLNSSLKIILQHLNTNGIICIQVPDASRFSHYDDAPFQQLSTEHINYFSNISLKNLLKKHGVYQDKCIVGEHPQSATTNMPVITTVFQKTNNFNLNYAFDKRTKDDIIKYIILSKKVENSIKKTISKLVKNQTPIIVWGVGTHTLHLLKSTSLSSANIVAFIDRNKSYHNRTLNNISILSPDSLKSMKETILVSSRVFQIEIIEMIRSQLKVRNPIITFYKFD